MFAYFEKDRKSAENFNRAMTSFSTVEAPTIAKSYDFSGIRSLTDIGGGHGLFLATILERYPDMTGTLFELPQVVNSLADGPLEQFKNRVRVLAGDMFRSVPAGADAYIMKRIVPSELRRDAHDCIMVPILTDRPNTRMRAIFAPDGELPSELSSFAAGPFFIAARKPCPTKTASGLPLPGQSGLSPRTTPSA